jgi:transcriptional regulator with XRE-family HTH domain
METMLARRTRRRFYESATRRERRSADVTLLELAAASGLSLNALAQAERGERVLTPDQEQRRRRALALLAKVGR